MIRNSRWLYSVYLEKMGWIDSDLFPQHVLEGSNCSFLNSYHHI
jgi:hypothetical protein